MTISELQRIVLRLSNSCWCRYWCLWREKPAQMAIQCIDSVASEPKGFGPAPVDDLIRYGFKVETTTNADWFYVIDRTNDDGTPYVQRAL